MWELRQIQPIELHSVMDLVRPGIERVRVKGKAPWKWEDVYAAAQSGRATMHIGYLDNQYAGVVVLALNTDPFNGERSLLVWALYTRKKAALFYGLRDVRDIARRAGVAKVVFHSVREGWIKRMADIGFHIKERVFEAAI